MDDRLARHATYTRHATRVVPWPPCLCSGRLWLLRVLKCARTARHDGRSVAGHPAIIPPHITLNTNIHHIYVFSPQHVKSSQFSSRGAEHQTVSTIKRSVVVAVAVISIGYTAHRDIDTATKRAVPARILLLSRHARHTGNPYVVSGTVHVCPHVLDRSIDSLMRPHE